MKLLSAILLVLASTTAFGKVLTCKVIDASVPPPGPQSYLEVNVGRTSVESIHLIHQVSEELYASQIRGGKSITFCNPDDNEFSESTGKIRTHSHCFNDTGELFFGAYLSTKAKGDVKLRILESNGDIVSRNFATEACK